MPNPHTQWRSPRAHLGDVTPAILRLPDGRQHRGQLEVVSLNGGLLNMTDMLKQGSQLKLLFVTESGPVLGAVEMLRPVSATRQPFRFVNVEGGDQRRLRATVHSHTEAAPEPWIDKYRAATFQQPEKPSRLRRIVLRSLPFVALLGGLVYFVNTHFLR
ncbi:MAG TPA: hypothetical protein VHW45_08225 [Candidatus Sulfotelmatobacter sp.]|jgi:hypothetical protein|nr:hypothetical protein [Candidatus Sulfotelmatobacter sp.]